MGITLSPQIGFLKNSSPPFLTHYWMSTLRDVPSDIPLPTRAYSGRAAFKRIRNDHNAFVAAFVALTSAGALRIMDRVEQNVLSNKIDAKAFSDCFIRDFNMLAVISALISQLSITALALPLLSNVHWLCKASLVCSLGFGCLAAWFSSNMARNLSSLDSADDVKGWLSQPAGMKEQKQFYKSYAARFRNIGPDTAEEKAIAKAMLIDFINQNKWKQASYYSCLMLALPSSVLNCSIAFFLFGVAIYLGDVMASHLDPTAGDIASRAVLICYTIGIGMLFVVFFFTSNRKDAELGFIRQMISQLELDVSESNTESMDVENGKT